MVLVAAVHEYMTAAHDDQHEDLLRAFFRLHLSNFGLLFPHVADIIARAASEAPNRMSDLLLEANRIVIVRYTVMTFRTVLDPPDRLCLLQRGSGAETMRRSIRSNLL
jgi:hypothetical protein